MEAKESRGAGRKKKTALLLAAGCLVVAVLVSAATIFFMQMKQNKEEAAAGTALSERIIKKVSALYLVPSSETPTVAKIQNKDSIEGNRDFYKYAQDGDYVLVYGKEKVALLYRESINKLVKVSPIITPEPDTQTGR